MDTHHILLFHLVLLLSTLLFHFYLVNFKEKNIILIALFPNSTHVIQPLDRTFFRPLKKAWGQAVEQFKREKCTINIKKEDFGNILQTALSALDLKAIMKNDFEVCGLNPFNANRVNYALLKYRNAENISNESVESLNSSDIEKERAECRQALQVIEKNIDTDIIENFKKSESMGEWTGDVENKGLFQLWRKLQNSSGFQINEDHSQIENNAIENNLVFDTEINFNAILIITEDALPINSVIAEVDFISPLLDENFQSQLFNEISNSGDLDNSNVLKEITTGNDDSNKDKNTINVNTVNVNPGNSAQIRILDNSKKPGTDVENKENTQTENKSIPPNVTSPFKRSLLWPPELGPKKRKYKSKNQNISVATTEEWIYIQEKEAEEKKNKKNLKSSLKKN